MENKFKSFSIDNGDKYFYLAQKRDLLKLEYLRYSCSLFESSIKMIIQYHLREDKRIHWKDNVVTRHTVENQHPIICTQLGLVLVNGFPSPVEHVPDWRLTASKYTKTDRNLSLSAAFQLLIFNSLFLQSKILLLTLMLNWARTYIPQRLDRHQPLYWQVPFICFTPFCLVKIE